MRFSASFHSSRSSTRTVPRNEPRCGMALAAMPALTAPQTSDMPDRGSTCRESRPGRSVISRPRASTRSTVSCGRAVCPPGPVSVMSIRSQAAVMAPVRRPTVPAGTEGSQCSANAREAPSSTPEATTSVAPPGMVSSAGWKITARCRAARRAVASAMATPRTTVVCTSCPQAWHRPSRVDA